MCFKVIEVETEQNIIRCDSCKYKQQIKSLKECKQIEAHMDVNEQLKNVQRAGKAFETMLLVENKATLRQDTDEFEDYIVLNKFNVTVTLASLTVVDIAKN